MNIRAILFISILFLPLLSRENPFFPVSGSTIPNYSTNQIEKPKPFDSIKVKLPDSVRILKSVTLKCENLDGSITQKEIPINKAVDWHNKIIISQESKDLKKSSKAKKGKKKTQRFKKIGSLEFISFYALGKKLKIITKDKLLRKFKLVKPDRIVLDFKRDADFRTFVFRGSGIFKKISVGNHKGYYRAVIELDGRYLYHVRSISNGYMLKVE